MKWSEIENIEHSPFSSRGGWFHFLSLLERLGKSVVGVGVFEFKASLVVGDWWSEIAGEVFIGRKCLRFLRVLPPFSKVTQ